MFLIFSKINRYNLIFPLTLKLFNILFCSNKLIIFRLIVSVTASGIISPLAILISWIVFADELLPRFCLVWASWLAASSWEDLWLKLLAHQLLVTDFSTFLVSANLLLFRWECLLLYCLLFVFLVLMLSLCIKFYEFLNQDFLRILLLFAVLWDFMTVV